MEKKKRILLCNEASFLATGFSTYGLEVMKRLHATGKYELAEFATYGSPHDERKNSLPWKYYPNLPANQTEEQVYNSKPTNQFGEWKFELACLDFKPDIVWDIRDWWMLEYQERSPFRKYFKWVVMPTVDAVPQQDQWMATYMGADGVFSYSDWGYDVLMKQSQGRMKGFGSAPPGIDMKAYKVPTDKREHRSSMGIEKDIFIIGTIMRNQSRKLYPELIQAFRLFLDKAPKEMAANTYLYLHCAHPDIGWDIPKLVKEAGVANRCIFTYFCQACQVIYPSFYQDVMAVCKQCGQLAAIMPRVQKGISREALADIIGLFDAYVQYSLCEGFGLPQIEAAACGVPVFAVDYSAMSDVVRKIEGFPVDVQAYFRESETHCLRAIPNNSHLVTLLIDYLSKPREYRIAKGKDSRRLVEKHYSWDATAKKWERCFDYFECSDQKYSWLRPEPLIHQPATESPPHLSNEEFTRWAIEHIAGRPDLVNGYMSMRMTRDLNWGACHPGTGGIYFNEAGLLGSQETIKDFQRKDAAEALFQLCEINNLWEMERVKGLKNG